MAADVDTATHNRALYLAWLRSNFPDLYVEATQPRGMLSGLFDSIGSAFNNVLTNVTNSLPQLANTYAQYQAQRQLIETNTQRVRQGLPPLVLDSNGQLVDMSGNAYTSDDWQLAQTGGLSTGSVLMIAAAIGLAIVLLVRK